MDQTTLAIQRALSAAGFPPGPLDGIRGRRTIRATRLFQSAHGLEVDGIVGPLTARVLFGTPRAAVPTTDSTPWITEARRLIGTREAPGPGSNPEILDWADGLGLDSYSDDDIPWCGLFVAHCIASQLPEEPLPPNILAARAWQAFGRPVTPRAGAVLVFWRGKRAGWQGHVGFYASEDASTFHVLGGNQSNAVNIARISKSRLLGAFWPHTAPTAGAGRIVTSAPGAALSTNEA